MLTDYNVDNFSGSNSLALLLMRESIWNRKTRDFLLPDSRYSRYDSFHDMTGGKGFFTIETTHTILNSSIGNARGEGTSNPAVRWMCDAADFRELCRIFGERYAAVSAFELRCEYSFTGREGRRYRQTRSGNVLSYLRIEIVCKRIYDSDRTAFLELVRYRGGDNFDLYWDGFPDADLSFTDGRARGCNIFMRGLSVYDIQSDGVPAGVKFSAILPVVIAFSRIAASQYDYIISADERIEELSAAAEDRCIWVDPAGKVRFTGLNAALSEWGFSCDEQDRDCKVLSAMISSAPGETLLVPDKGFCVSSRHFLKMQEKAFKKAMHL